MRASTVLALFNETCACIEKLVKHITVIANKIFVFISIRFKLPNFYFLTAFFLEDAIGGFCKALGFN